MSNPRVRCTDCIHQISRQHCPVRPVVRCNKHPRVCALHHALQAPKAALKLLQRSGLDRHIADLAYIGGQLAVRYRMDMPFEAKERIGLVLPVLTVALLEDSEIEHTPPPATEEGGIMAPRLSACS